jgi:hypothetical protein
MRREREREREGERVREREFESSRVREFERVCVHAYVLRIRVSQVSRSNEANESKEYDHHKSSIPKSKSLERRGTITHIGEEGEGGRELASPAST